MLYNIHTYTYVINSCTLYMVIFLSQQCRVHQLLFYSLQIGDVKALPLPMACTLTQFQEGNKYHFAVRAVDTHERLGVFSDPSSIHLTKTV